MIDKYIRIPDAEGPGGYYHWDGELDEDKQFQDAFELSVAIWDFALPFLLTCDDPIGVLQYAMDSVVENSIEWLPMQDWVDNHKFQGTLEEVFAALMTRQITTGEV